MKFIPVEMAYFLRNRQARRNVALLLRFVYALAGIIVLYSVAFHVIMLYEGQQHSWLTGLYWVMVVMSTLGFGDITFTSDVGRAFSVLVIVTGVIFLLVMMPFAFIQFFLSPWLEAQSQARAPRSVPPGTRDHLVITSFDPVTENLMRRLHDLKIPYVLIVPELHRGLELFDLGFKVMVGHLDDPETYRLCNARDAALIVATGNEMVNTSITFTVRDVSESVPIIANAEAHEAVEILRLAGATHIFEMKAMLGRFLARWAIGSNSRVNVIGRVDQLLIAEASATRTPLVGKTLAESRLRETTGVTIVGLWERGTFHPAQANSVISPASVLVLAGTQEQMDAYDALLCIYVAHEAPVVILGGGRVGRAAARELVAREIDYRIVEKNPAKAKSTKHVVGSAADIEVLKEAGLDKAMTALITTSDDDTNIYLTVYCRKLFPELQIISRANNERNVSTLHRAGADFVMSYASLGSNIIMDVLRGEDLVMFAEGLTVMRITVPEDAPPHTVLNSRIREETGTNIIAIKRNGQMTVNPMPDADILPQDEVVIAGDPNRENEVLDLLKKAPAEAEA